MSEEEGILDRLIRDNPDIISQGSGEIVIPRRCAYCKTSTICSVLPNIVAVSRIGIFLSIEKCPYNVPSKDKGTPDKGV